MMNGMLRALFFLLIFSVVSCGEIDVPSGDGNPSGADNSSDNDEHKNDFTGDDADQENDDSEKSDNEKENGDTENDEELPDDESDPEPEPECPTGQKKACYGGDVWCFSGSEPYSELKKCGDGCQNASCNFCGDGVCFGKENSDNCPEDCPPPVEEECKLKEVFIDFDDVPSGTLITDQYENVVFSGDPAPYASSTMNLGNSQPNYLQSGYWCTGTIILEFIKPVDNFSFFVVGTNNSGNVGSIKIETISGNYDEYLEGDGKLSNPNLQDFSEYSGIKKITIHEITDSFGLTYDDFSFTYCE